MTEAAIAGPRPTRALTAERIYPPKVLGSSSPFGAPMVPPLLDAVPKAASTTTGTHCAFPSVQTEDVASFVDRFLLGKTATNVAKSPYKTDLAKWITWSTPTLQ